MRLFLAVPVPETVRVELVRLRTLWQRAWPLARWIPPENWHITLRFLGEVPEERVGEVQNWMQRQLNGLAGGEVALDQSGCFEQRSRYVLWVGLDNPGWMAELAARLQGEVAGIIPEKRGFVPHLTLARVEVRRSEGKAFAEFLKEFQQTSVAKVASPVKEVRLYRSELQAGGARYSVVTRCPLL